MVVLDCALTSGCKCRTILSIAYSIGMITYPNSLGFYANLPLNPFIMLALQYSDVPIFMHRIIRGRKDPVTGSPSGATIPVSRGTSSAREQTGSVRRRSVTVSRGTRSPSAAAIRAYTETAFQEGGQVYF